MIVPTPVPGALPGGAAFASIVLGGRDLEGVNVVVDYNNAAIKGHVDVEAGTTKDGLIALISQSDDQGRSTTPTHVDANKNFALDGLKPGHYQISIINMARLPDMNQGMLAEKTIELKKNTQAQMSLTIKQKEK